MLRNAYRKHLLANIPWFFGLICLLLPSKLPSHNTPVEKGLADYTPLLTDFEQPPLPRFAFLHSLPARSLADISMDTTLPQVTLRNLRTNTTPLIKNSTTLSYTYNQTLTSIAQKRQQLQVALSAASLDQQPELLEQAQQLFADAIVNQIMPAWYGTPWNFYGHSETPQQGSIACGYLVSTVLKHSGVQLNRYKLAQQWPSTIVYSLVGNEMQHFFQIEDVVAAVRQLGHGVYVLGLDRHVGFVKYDSWGIHFIHANYMGSQTVVCESPDYSKAMHQSHNFYLGSLSQNPEFLSAWCAGKPFAVGQ